VLRLVNDSELEDATGSIGGCVVGAGRTRDADTWQRWRERREVSERE
jgi:hypothetical protein